MSAAQVYIHLYDEDRCRMSHRLYFLDDYASPKVAARLIAQELRVGKSSHSRPVTFVQVEVFDDSDRLVISSWDHLQDVFTTTDGLAGFLLGLIDPNTVEVSK